MRSAKMGFKHVGFIDKKGDAVGIDLTCEGITTLFAGLAFGRVDPA